MIAMNFAPVARLTGRLAAMLATVLLLALPTAWAQGVPQYVVSSQTTVFTNLNGGTANYAVNSRGDFFFNAGPGSAGAITYELPANGGTPIALFTIPPGGSYGSSGVAVDSNDNLYITNFYGPSGNNDVDSQIYVFPFTNGSYPAPYKYSAGSPPGSCSPATPAQPGTATSAPIAAQPANTGVCAYGQYTSASNYYYQPIGIAVDGLGNSYMYTNYDNTNNNKRNGIFFCDVLCGQQGLGGNAYALVTGLANGIQSITANATGDCYYVDGVTVSYIAKGAKTPTVFDSSYNKPSGINFDRAGNLYVTDSTGIYETPFIGGKLNAGQKFLLLPVSPGAQASVAVDTRGNLYYSPYYNAMFKIQLWSATFAQAPVGQVSTVQNFTITFDAATTLGSIKALQGNAAATEFAVTPGTCAVGASFQPNTTCTFSATFTPAAVGRRSGTIVIADSTGKTSSTYLTGIGSGTGIAVDPGTPSSVGTGLKAPSGLALDAAGNVFVADATANKVYEFPVGGGAAISLGSNLSVPTGVAVDGTGNVFILNRGTASGLGTVVEVPNLNGVLTTASQTTLFTGLKLPTDIVLDGDGNFFITNTGNNEVLQYPSISRYGTSTTAVSLGTALSGPTGIALDLTGSIYVADTGNNRIVQIGDGFQTIIGAGLNAPTGVAVEPSGAVLIADQGTGRILRIPNEKVTGLNASDQVLLNSPLLYPYSIRLDSAGNLYASDNQGAAISMLQRTSGLASFGNYNLNTTSSPATLILSSTGTQDVTLGSPLFAPVPASSGYTVSAGTAVTACAGTTLASGYNCTLNASFTPTVLGASNYNLALAAPAFNSAAPVVKLSGVGVNLSSATVTIAQTSPTGALNYGAPFVISVTVTPTGNTPTPTGNVVFSFDGQDQRPVALNAKGIAAITFSNVQAGPHKVQAHYLGDTNYASVVTAVLPLTIQLAPVVSTLKVSADAATPLSSAPGNSVGLTVTLAPSTVGLFQGTVNFTSGSTFIGKATVTGPDPVTGFYSASFSTSNLLAGTYNIVASYSGNANYAASTSSAVQLIITPPTFTITTNSNLVTSSAATAGAVNLVVTSYSAFQGGVDLTCSGLPANAYCVFRPGLASLLAAPNTTPFAVTPIPITLQFRVDQDPNVIASASSLGWFGAAMALLTLLVAVRRRSLRGLALTWLLVLFSLGGMAALGGCGKASTAFPTPPGVYPIKITAVATPVPSGGGNGNQANNITVTMNVQLTVQ